MELIATRQDEAGPGRVRLVGTVAYDDRPHQPEEYWYELPAEYADRLTKSGNPWIVCLAPLAAKLGEPLRIRPFVDALLLRNIREVLAIWKAWFPGSHIVPIDADSTESRTESERKTALFFSAGVDSFFSLYRNERPEPGSFPVDDLISVHGFDIHIEREDAFERHRRRIQAVAEATGKTLVPVRTNLRRTRLREADWGTLSHGCALAGVGLTLESRYETLLLASTNHYSALDEWGTHPLTDPLLSTEHTRFLHDGAAFRRWQKLELLSKIDVVLQTLHVCFRDGSDINCGECEKCLRNMIILDVLGALDRCLAFRNRRLDLDRVARIFIGTGWQPSFYRSLRDFAASRGRFDVVDAIDRSFRRSAIRRPIVKFAERLGRHRGVWRLRRPITNLALGALSR